MINFILGFVISFCSLLSYHATVYIFREKRPFPGLNYSNKELNDLHKKIDDISLKLSSPKS
jgi:hypothetical protein